MDSADIAIRPATVSDAAGIARVHVYGWLFAFHGEVPCSRITDQLVDTRTRFWQHAIENPLPRSVTLVAVQNDRIVGFCNHGSSGDDDAPENRGKIAAIYVDPSEMRRGIGTRLMDAALDHLSQERFRDVILWVLENNEIGRRFCERYGWKTDGTTKTDNIAHSEVREIRYRLELHNL